MRDTADLRAWHREDIARMLVSINAASIHDSAIEYRLGFRAALVCVALACGIEPQEIMIETTWRNGQT